MVPERADEQVQGDSAQGASASSLAEQCSELIRRIEAEPGLAEVAEAMKQYDVTPYAVFSEEPDTIYFAVGTNS